MSSNKEGSVVDEIGISVIANHFIEKYLNKSLLEHFGEDNLNIKISNVPYEVFSDISYEQVLTQSDIVLVWLDFEYLFPKGKSFSSISRQECDIVWNLVLQIQTYLKQRNIKKILWVSFDKYYTNIWNYCGSLLSEDNPVDLLNSRIIHNIENITMIDSAHIIVRIGLENAYSLKHADLWNIKYSKQMMECISKEVYKQYKIMYGRTLKCLVTDCDNVLWKGILSEDGIDQISVSGIHRAYQQELLNLYQKGIILCIASKNDKEDVDSAFGSKESILLKCDHFACIEASWDDKVESIINISNKLNIGMDSIMFVDDSPFEIENVKRRIPEVKACLFDGDILNKLSLFNLPLSVDAESVEKRHTTYRDNVLREEMKIEAKSYEEYLEILNSNVTIELAVEKDAERLTELSQRTNKCTNGKRFSTMEMLEQINDKAVYKVSLTDSLGDLGIVGIINVQSSEQKNVLELFCLSCRALGRSVEKQMIEFINSTYNVSKVYFKSTNKNASVYTLLSSIGEIEEG